MVAVILLAVGMFGISGPSAQAQSSRCKIALVLALDVSGSVNWKEFRLQSNGTADAFEDADVLQLLSYYQGGVMVTLMQWADSGYQEVSVGWTEIKLPEDAQEFADSVRKISRGPTALTATGTALHFAENLFATAPVACDRQIIDVSTDGRSNRGVDLPQAANTVSADGTIINALVIYGEDLELESYLRTNLVRGAGAFSHAIVSYSDYPVAIKRKLLRELQPTISMLSP